MWHRTSKLNNKQANEIWHRTEGGLTEQFDVETIFGKKTDLLTLKRNVVSRLEENFEFYSRSRTDFFSNPQNLQFVDCCPVCNISSAKTEYCTTIYSAAYYQCQHCSHIYLKEIPTLPAIEEFYRKNTQYAQTYTDRESAEFRLNTVDMELAGFMEKRYEKIYGTLPSRILDIGAGGGHFVEACKRKGYEAAGFEFSDSSVNFSKEVWGINLDQRDYSKVYSDYIGYDVVSFWGLLEHVPNPQEFVAAAAASIEGSKKGMILCRVPKWDAVSTVVQSLTPDSIVRHLDPLGHIMIYTESSICELFRTINYKPSAIWYYGMDTYELFIQLGHLQGNYDHLKSAGKLQMEVQQKLDEYYLSDLMVMAFTPNQ